jgi:hypothetical protein
MRNSGKERKVNDGSDENCMHLINLGSSVTVSILPLFTSSFACKNKEEVMSQRNVHLLSEKTHFSTHLTATNIYLITLSKYFYGKFDIIFL